MKKHFILITLLLILNVNSSDCVSQQVDSEISTIYKTESNILYYEGDESSLDPYIFERCRLDLYYPANKSNYQTVVWFHGGGLRAGERSFPEELMKKGIAIVAVNYRLFPRVESPAYIEDTAAAVAWVFKNIKNYRGNSEKIYLSGHSAGGYLVSMVGLDKSYLCVHEINADSIAGLIPFSGHAITHFTIRSWRTTNY